MATGNMSANRLWGFYFPLAQNARNLFHDFTIYCDNMGRFHIFDKGKSMRIFSLVGIFILFAGCYQERMTAARTGCAPEELDYPEGRHWIITPTHWEALCNGKRYACKTKPENFLLFWGWQDTECALVSAP